MERPIDIAFHPHSHRGDVLDFGKFKMAGGNKIKAVAGTGKFWRLPANFMEI